MSQYARYLARCKVVNYQLREHTFHLFVPPTVFCPDPHWSKIFLEGSIKVINEKDGSLLIVEVGIGSGIAPIFLNECLSNKVRHFIGLDINPIACEATRINLLLNGCTLQYELRAGGSLLDAMPANVLKEVDLILANLPQIPAEHDTNENLNDYYSAKKLQSDPILDYYEISGLGLLRRLLQAAPRYLAPNGVVVCTLSGRCAPRTRESLLREFCRHFEYLSSCRVPQDPGTSIKSLAIAEQEHDLTFCFYGDESSENALSATEAYRRQKAGEPVFHDLMVAALMLR